MWDCPCSVPSCTKEGVSIRTVNTLSAGFLSLETRILVQSN